MCHEWWMRRMYEEREASRELWEEFGRTRPAGDPEPQREDAEITLERPDAEPVIAER